MGELRGSGRVFRGNSNSLSGFNLKHVSLNSLCADSEHTIYLEIYSGFKCFFSVMAIPNASFIFCLGRVTEMLFLSCTHSNSHVSYDMTCMLSCRFLVTTTPRNSIKPSISDCVILHLCFKLQIRSRVLFDSFGCRLIISQRMSWPLYTAEILIACVLTTNRTSKRSQGHCARKDLIICSS